MKDRPGEAIAGCEHVMLAVREELRRMQIAVE
jgi:hypothetical protein